MQRCSCIYSKHKLIKNDTWLFLSIDFLQFLSSVSTLGQIKIHSGISKSKSMALQKSFQCLGLCFSSSHWFGGGVLGAFTSHHCDTFQATLCLSLTKLCLLLCLKMPEGPGLCLCFGQNAGTTEILTTVLWDKEESEGRNQTTDILTNDLAVVTTSSQEKTHGKLHLGEDKDREKAVFNWQRK